jgi:hypothetical protein
VPMLFYHPILVLFLFFFFFCGNALFSLDISPWCLSNFSWNTHNFTYFFFSPHLSFGRFLEVLSSSLLCVILHVLCFPILHLHVFTQIRWLYIILTWRDNNGWSVNKGCATLVALPFTFKSILSQKKNYGNSNISHAKT